MKMKIARRLTLVLLGGLGWMGATPAQTLDYPRNPIRLIVPFTAGGPTDAMARDLAKRMSDDLGKPIVVENRTGSGGNIGALLVARSPADGYTLLFASNGPLAGNLSLYKNMPYHPLKDLAPISNYAAMANVLAVHSSFPAQTLQEFIKEIKAHPGKYSYSSGGNGTTQHLSGELLKTVAKIDMQHVAYKGESAALLDTLSGLVPITFCNVSSCMPYIQSGKLRAIALTGPKRLATQPKLPTIAETYAGFDLRAWFGLAAPAHTPAPIINQLSLLVNKISASDEVKSRFDSMGMERMANSPEDFSAFMHTEVKKWADLIEMSGAKLE